MDKLYYLDLKQDELRSVEYTRDRATSVSPIFYSSRRDGLIALKSALELKMQGCVCKIMEIERELAREK